MVWLLPASQGTRLHIIILITYLVALGGFTHIIAGSVDVFYLVNTGTVSLLTYFIGFMLPTLIGNIIGGVSLVAALNFAQVTAETEDKIHKNLPKRMSCGCAATCTRILHPQPLLSDGHEAFFTG